MISWEDDSCANCRTPKPLHDEMLRRFGSIRFVKPTFMAAKFIIESDPWPCPEPNYMNVHECRKFVKSFELFDRDGNPVERWPAL